MVNIFIRQRFINFQSLSHMYGNRDGHQCAENIVTEV